MLEGDLTRSERVAWALLNVLFLPFTLVDWLIEKHPGLTLLGLWSVVIGAAVLIWRAI